MFITSALLIAIGLAVALLGVRLFRLFLPLVGLVTGAAAGFIGIQAVFGTGAVATSTAIIVAVILGMILMLLSFAFFDIAVTVYIALLGAAIFGYLGVAIGLNAEGFLVFLLSVTGAIIAATAAIRSNASLAAVMLFTSFTGIAYVLAGAFLLSGGLSLDQLNSKGIGGSILEVVDQSFLWLLVWLGASLLAWQVQARAFFDNYLADSFAYTESKK